MAKSSKYHHGELKQAALERTIEIISSDGVEAVSLRGLARDVGVSHPALLRHFQNRNDLLAAVAREGVEALFKSAASHIDDSGLSGVEKLKAMAEGYVGWAQGNPAYHLALRNHDVMRHADAQLLARLKDYSLLQYDAIREAQKAGWYSDIPEKIVLMKVASFAAGLALLVTDPIYKTPMEGTPAPAEVQQALDSFFS